eukprot:3554604-Rhodomonas_salina.1
MAHVATVHAPLPYMPLTALSASCTACPVPTWAWPGTNLGARSCTALCSSVCNMPWTALCPSRPVPDNNMPNAHARACPTVQALAGGERDRGVGGALRGALGAG